jgi:hypothetical protein
VTSPIHVPTSPSSVDSNDSFTKSLLAALDSKVVKDSLHKVIGEAIRKESEVIRKEVQSAIRESISTELQAIIQPLEDKFQALEFESDRRFTVNSDQIKELNDSKKIMEDKIATMERAYRSSNLKITGINLHIPAVPRNPQDNEGADLPRPDMQEILKDKIFEVFHEAGIVNVLREDIVNIQKFKLQGQPSLLIVKMVNEAKKIVLYKQRTKLRNCSTKIYMNEDLTRQDSQLFKQGREDVKNKRLHSVWTLNGRVFAKKEEQGKPFVYRNDGVFDNYLDS